MRQRELDESLGAIMSGVCLPRRIAHDPLRSVVIVGFDTEWDQNKDLLSVQFAVHVGGRRVATVVEPPPRLEVQWFTEAVVRFLRDSGVEVPVVTGVRRFVLVAHFAMAELSMFKDALRDLHIDQVNKAHHATGPVVVVEGLKWKFRIVDLFAFFPTSLAEIGTSIGLPKLDADRTRLAELKLADRKAFEAYAARDAEIAVEALTQFRIATFEKFGLDVLSVKSLAGLASLIFRARYLQRPAAPVITVTEQSRRKNQRTGEWVITTKPVARFAGDRDARYLAARAAWGARVEPYCFGLVVGPCVELDVISQYPHAAIEQPLPNDSTVWMAVKALDEVFELEGFAEVSFRFPKDQLYPCLPVFDEGKGRLTFPTSGQTCCTFAEVRAAVGLGAAVKLIEGRGFRPTINEREHDVARYMRDRIKEKADAPKGSLLYIVAKLLLNALIGKFWERSEGSNILSFEREARQHGAPGLGKVVVGSSQLRGVVGRRVKVGPAFAIEWAALILGRARELMASIVARGAYLISTDAVIVPSSLDVESEGLARLRAVGSDLKVEHSGDAVFIARARVYAILKRTENLTAGDVHLAKDATWAVIKAVRHGSVESKLEFAETILACLRAGKDVAPEREAVRLASAENAVRLGVEINAELPRKGKTHLSWDKKRRLQDRDINPFRSFSTTAPFASVARMAAAERQRRAKAGMTRRRRAKRSRATTHRVFSLLRQGVGVREVSRLTGVPASTVSDLKQRLPAVQSSPPGAESPTTKE